MKIEEDEKIFLRVSPELKSRWAAMCLARNVPQTTAGFRIVEWIVSQPADVQLMILGSSPWSADVIRHAVDAIKREDRTDARMKITPLKDVAQTPPGGVKPRNKKP